MFLCGHIGHLAMGSERAFQAERHLSGHRKTSFCCVCQGGVNSKDRIFDEAIPVLVLFVHVGAKDTGQRPVGPLHQPVRLRMAI